MGFAPTFGVGAPAHQWGHVRQARGGRPGRVARFFTFRGVRCPVRSVAARDLEPCPAMSLWSSGSNRSAFRTLEVAPGGVQARKSECHDAG